MGERWAGHAGVAKTVPDYIDCVTVIADDDDAGRRHASELVGAASQTRLRNDLEISTREVVMKDDANSIHRKFGLDGLRAALDEAPRSRSESRTTNSTETTTLHRSTSPTTSTGRSAISNAASSKRLTWRINQSRNDYWIVEDVVPDENLTLLTGEGGIGKTTLADNSPSPCGSTATGSA